MPTPPAPQQQQQQPRQMMGVTTGDPPTIDSPDNVSIASTSQVGSLLQLVVPSLCITYLIVTTLSLRYLPVFLLGRFVKLVK